MLFFCLLALALGIGHLALFIRKPGIGNLVIGDDFIEIPERWKGRIRLNFNEILEIREFDTYDNVIEIESKQGVCSIERNWMTQNDFEKLKRKLQNI